MSNEELTNVIASIVEANREIDQLKAYVEELKSQVQGAMVDAGVDKLTGPWWTASWINVTSRRLDTKAIQAALPETCEQFMKESTTTRFNIRVK